MIANILYSAPVTVSVDMETGEIVSVSVGDEYATPDESSRGWTDNYSRELTDDEQRQAYEHARAATEWPAWNFG